jgi:hypothetical protein
VPPDWTLGGPSLKVPIRVGVRSQVAEMPMLAPIHVRSSCRALSG